MSIVVVEGPDGGGKSTLIDNLRLSCDRHYISLRRSGPPKFADEIHEVLGWIGRAKHLSVPLILDRHPLISEDIYGPILRGSSLLTHWYDNEEVIAIFKQTVDRVIYCRPPTNVIYNKLHANPQLKGVAEKIGEITQQYDFTMKLLEHWGVHVIWYDWTAEHEGDSANLGVMFFG